VHLLVFILCLFDIIILGHGYEQDKFP
jgi:hypothetical protein